MPAAEGPPSADPTESVDVVAVRAAHRAFYEAFEARDLDAMSEAWEHSDRVVCTHPGWRTLRGWAAVSASWFALFDGPQQLQFILTEEQVAVAGDTAWVTVDENLIDTEVGATVAALNLFHRTRTSDGADRWLLVAHHGSGVAAQGFG